MTYMRLLAVAFIVWTAVAAPFGSAAAQSQLTLSGRVLIQMKGTRPRLTVRLYPERETKRPTLITYTDAAGNFKFTGLESGRYLLELYNSNALVYQKVLVLDKDHPPPPLVITLRAQ